MDDKKRESLRENDLRVRRTQKALHDAIIALLNQRNFNHITVHDLCAAALISRATFYAHFRDKYDLLGYLLSEIKERIVKDVYRYDELEEAVNQFICENKKLISHILKDANSETLTLIRRFMSSIVELAIKRKISDEISPQHTILFNFFIGGLVNLLTWIVENDYPPEITMMNTYLYEMLEIVTVWDAEQGEMKTVP